MRKSLTVLTLASLMLPVVACTTIPPTPGAGGSGGGGAGGGAGAGGAGGMIGQSFPCTEQGIRNAIAAGNGPNTFDCDGPTRVTTSADIFIDKDVILDGGGNLIVDGNDDHRVFEVASDTTVELRGMTITKASGSSGGGLLIGTGALVTVRSSGISDCFAADAAGILVTDRARLTLIDSTVSGNTAAVGGGMIIASGGTAIVERSTISANNATALAGGGVLVAGALTLTNSTLSGNLPNSINAATGSSTTLTSSTVSAADPSLSVPTIFIDDASLTMVNCILSGVCNADTVTSGGHNIESPGNTCGLGGIGDNINIPAALLDLGPLQPNGGPTQTHVPGPGSPGIDAIDVSDCEVVDDQRGIERPQGPRCDVGSVEVVP